MADPRIVEVEAFGEFRSVTDFTEESDIRHHARSRQEQSDQ
jgi:hypothetical protein